MSSPRETGHETHGAASSAASGPLMLSDGTVVRVRTMSPTDAPALQRLHARLGERSIELRFFGPMAELSDEMAANLADADGFDHFALVALDPERPGEIVAVVRYAREEGGERAEYAALVEDRWQGRRLGPSLTNRLIEVAREGGIGRLYALVTPENARMMGLLRALGLPTHESREGGATRVELDLLPLEGEGVAEPRRPREGPGDEPSGVAQHRPG